MEPLERYLEVCRGLIDRVAAQREEISTAADWFAEAILAGGVVHLFGTGHSRIMVEEMWPRYGSFPGFHPIVELSLTHHNSVVGSGGQRQAMFLENVSGLAARILRNYSVSPHDAALIVSSSGCNLVPIEMAAGFRSLGVRTVGLLSRAHAEASTSHHPQGEKLSDGVDLILDTGAPAGDAVVTVDGLEEKVAPASTVGGCLVVNALKAEIAQRLTRAGSPPRVLTAPCLVGEERSRELFEAAYDEHGRRLGRLLARGRSDAECGRA